jgi:hypothetical protein
MEQTINIIKALCQLCDSGQFNVNTDGAAKIAVLRQSADRLVGELEAELAAAQEEETEDVDIQE